MSILWLWAADGVWVHGVEMLIYWWAHTKGELWRQSARSRYCHLDRLVKVNVGALQPVHWNDLRLSSDVDQTGFGAWLNDFEWAHKRGQQWMSSWMKTHFASCRLVGTEPHFVPCCEVGMGASERTYSRTRCWWLLWSDWFVSLGTKFFDSVSGVPYTTHVARLMSSPGVPWMLFGFPKVPKKVLGSS